MIAEAVDLFEEWILDTGDLLFSEWLEWRKTRRVDEEINRPAGAPVRTSFAELNDIMKQVYFFG